MITLIEKLDICVIAIVGKRGAIGLNGRLPWFDEESNYKFMNQTRGGVVIFGFNAHKTLASKSLYLERYIKVLLNRTPDEQRLKFLTFRGSDLLFKETPKDIINNIANKFRHLPIMPTIWIAGGRQTYIKFAPYVTRINIICINYDGPFDTTFPFEAFPCFNTN